MQQSKTPTTTQSLQETFGNGGRHPASTFTYDVLCYCWLRVIYLGAGGGSCGVVLPGAGGLLAFQVPSLREVAVLVGAAVVVVGWPAAVLRLVQEGVGGDSRNLGLRLPCHLGRLLWHVALAPEHEMPRCQGKGECTSSLWQ